MALEYGAINIGDSRFGNKYTQNGIEKVIESVCDDSMIVHAVFKDAETVARFLKAVKAANLGLSVTISGLFDEVEKICQRVELEKHTINQSLGRWGRTEKLPPMELLELNTMCGHGRVTVNLINDVVDSIKQGNCTPEEGAEHLSRPCLCGVFNPHRATRLLNVIVSQGEQSDNFHNSNR
jgi:hypothetical protein